MTRTEERLSDALRASADRVRDDRLRPFPALDPGAGLGMGRRAAWRAWLVPVAAAASVALIIGLAVAVTGAPQQADHAGAFHLDRVGGRVGAVSQGAGLVAGPPRGRRLAGRPYVLRRLPGVQRREVVEHESDLDLPPEHHRLGRGDAADQDQGAVSSTSLPLFGAPGAAWPSHPMAPSSLSPSTTQISAATTARAGRTRLSSSTWRPARDMCGAAACTGRARRSRSRTFRGPRTGDRLSFSGCGATTRRLRADVRAHRGREITVTRRSGRSAWERAAERLIAAPCSCRSRPATPSSRLRSPGRARPSSTWWCCPVRQARPVPGPRPLSKMSRRSTGRC